MKKISIYIISYLACIAGLMTSCSEDYPGPDPVDVTANYSNKFSNPNPNLSLSYNGEEMTGRSADFSTVKGEKGMLTLYNILPGEKAMKITNIPLMGDADGYSFRGNGTANITQSTFNYEGRVTKGHLTLTLTNVTMANANLWAKTYQFAEVEHGTKKTIEAGFEEGEYEWQDTPDKMISSAIYIGFPENGKPTETSYNAQNIGGVLQGILSYVLPNFLKDITLESDGNISASYSGDALKEENKETFIGNTLTAFLNMDVKDQQTITEATQNFQYTLSPKGLAYWHQRDGQIIIKLNLPAIISQIASEKGKDINQDIIASITDAIFSMDVLKLKSLLGTVNEKLQNDILGFIINMNDRSFNDFFNWLSNGIPMHIKIQDGHTYIYLDQEGITPIFKLFGDVSPVILKLLTDLSPDLAGLLPLIEQILITWPEAALSIQSFDFGLNLKPLN